MKRIFYILTAAVLSALVFASCASTPDGSVQQKNLRDSHAANDLFYHKDELDSYLAQNYGEKIRRTEFDTTSEDMTFSIRDNVLQSIILGEWNTKYQFHGLKVGSKISGAEQVLSGDFKNTSAYSTWDGLAVFTDRKNPDYYLELDFDEEGTIYLIKYAHSSLGR